MKSPAENIRPLVWKIFAGGLAVALALAGCDTQLAGSSVGTGNPTEIQLGFKQDGSATAISGRVDVYAATQVPVPGFSPLPLTSVPVTDGKTATVTAAAMGAIKDSLWPKSSIEGDSIYRFNLVVTGAAQGAILTGFGYRKGKGEFTIRSEDAGAARDGEAVAVMAALTTISPYQSKMDTASFSTDWDYYLFMYGTGFSSKAESGHFSFQGLPSGKYDSFVLLLPKSHHISSSVDSTTVFALTSSLDTGKDSLALGPIRDRIPIPDSLKSH